MRDGKEVARLPGQSYQLVQTDADSSVLLTPFTVGQELMWNHFVQFFPDFSRAEQRAFRAAVSALKADIAAQPDPAGNALRVASPAVVKPFDELFDAKFIWRPGDMSWNS